MKSLKISKFFVQWFHVLLFRHRTRVICLLILSIVIIFAAAAFSYCFGLQPPITKNSFRCFLLTNPGGIFALIVGIATIGGLWFAIESIYTIRSSIHSFSEFISKTCDLIDSTDNDKTVKILIRTPTTGCFALPKKIWMKLPNLLRESAEDKASVHIACPSIQDIKLWYEQKFPKVKAADRQEAIEENTDLMETLQTTEKTFQNRKRRNNTVDTIKRRIKTVDWYAFPGYYIVCNHRQAIFAIPFGMDINIDRSNEIVGNNTSDSIPENRLQGDRPKEKKDKTFDSKQGIEYSDPVKGKSKLPPEVIGFESTQFNVVEAANNIFDQFFGETVDD